MRFHTSQLLAIFFAIVLGLGLGTPASAQDSKDSKPAKSSKDSKDSRADVEQIGDREVGKGMNFYSLEEEIALGKSMAQQVEQSSRLVQDPVVTEYINRLGQNLVRNSDAQVPFTIKVIEDDTWNAFALPGGFFFVNSGLILAAETEAEIAGAMAHEIAHVAARHGTRNASKAELANWLSLPLIFLGGPVGFGARSAAGLLIPMKFLQFSRGAEREADFLGLQYMFKTGYDPDAFVAFFEKMQAREKNRPGSLAKAFSTHPLTPDRIDAAQAEIKNVLPPRDEYIVTTGEFERVHERLKMLDNRGKIEDAKQDSDRPTLRRRTTASPSATDSAGSSDEASGDTTATPDDNSQTDEDARPTLKRR